MMPEGKKLAIVAGSGALPHMVAAATRAQQMTPFVLALKNYAADWVTDFPHQWFALGDIQGQLDYLRQHGLTHLVLAGGVQRPKIGDLRLDRHAAAIMLKAARLGLGDDGLLGLVRTFLESQGITVLGAHDILRDGQMAAGLLAGAIHDPALHHDIDRGIRVVRQLGVVDVGQAVVVKQGVVHAVEAAEGTAAMLGRCHDAAGGVLVKLRKPQQDDRLDLPTIGPDTMTQAHQVGLAGIVIEAEATLVIDPVTVMDMARRQNQFILAVPRDAVGWPGMIARYDGR